MSAIDRETTVPRVASVLKSEAQRRMIIAAVRDGAITERVAYGMIDRQAYGELRPDEFEAVVALGRLRGAAAVDRRFMEGGIAAFRKHGDLEAVGRHLEVEADKVRQAANGDAEVQARMAKDVFIRTFGQF
ncbi:MAG: hypothetical protein VKS61_00645 [Candidatus Sericytochromatia bacterium]|nr:hypothetical protein [Candidatus Sericytochromatia bacterium]